MIGERGDCDEEGGSPSSVDSGEGVWRGGVGVTGWALEKGAGRGVGWERKTGAVLQEEGHSSDEAFSGEGRLDED